MISTKKLCYKIVEKISSLSTSVGTNTSNISTLTSTVNGLSSTVSSLNTKSTATTDYVVAKGEAAETVVGTGTWRWREWNSGKVEIWYNGSITVEATGSSGGVYRASKRISFPNGYALRKCACIVDGTIQGGWLNCGGLFDSSGTLTEPYTKVEVMAYRISSAPELNQTNVNIYACGEKNNA